MLVLRLETKTVYLKKGQEKVLGQISTSWMAWIKGYSNDLGAIHRGSRCNNSCFNK